MLIHPSRLIAIGAAVLASAFVRAPALAQDAVAARTSAYMLVPEERLAAERAAKSDARVLKVLGAGGPVLAGTSGVQVDKNDVMALASGATKKPAARYVTIALLNQATGRAAQVRVRLDDRSVVDVTAVPATDIPIMNEEAAQAFGLARADARVRAAIGPALDRFQLRLPGQPLPPLAAEILPVRAATDRDPCFGGRCVEILFRNERSYLPLRVRVVLNTGAVTLIQGERGGMR